jgi:hypothetical protein
VLYSDCSCVEFIIVDDEDDEFNEDSAKIESKTKKEDDKSIIAIII